MKNFIPIAVFFFMMPSHLTIGSASALAIIIAGFVPLPVSVVTFILNTTLLLAGFLVIGRDFGAKTVVTTVLLPVFLGICEILVPNVQSLTGDVFVDMICEIFLSGLGLAILFNCNASSGGLDIVAKILNKYLRIDLGRAISLSGLAVAAMVLVIGFELAKSSVEKIIAPTPFKKKIEEQNNGQKEDR